MVTTLNRVTVVVALLACAGILAAAERARDGAAGAASRDHYFFEPISPRLGLSQADVVTALQTHDGYLWVGGGSGLARFDGARFVSYRLSNTPAFLNHLVYCLLEDREGTLWVGTERGVLRYRNGAFTRVGLDDASVRTMVEDRAGTLWCGTFGHGLYRIDRGEIRRVDDPALPSPSVTSLCVDATGRVLMAFGRTGGVVAYAGGTFARFRPAELGSEILAMAATADGTLWFGSRREGLFRLQGDTLARFGPRDGLASWQVYELRAARDGGLWVMSDTLQKVMPGSGFHIEGVAAPLADRPGSVCEDHEGGVWICGRSSGLIYGRRLPFRSLTTESGLPGNAVKSVTQDAAGNLWISIARDGVVKVGPDGKVVSWKEAPGWPGGEAEAILAARDGTIWVGFLRGLFEFRDGHGTLHPEILNVGGLFEASDGSIWAGTSRDGIFRGRHGRFEKIDLGLPETPTFITSFAETADGTIYAGTWTDGLLRIGPERKELLTRAHGLPSNEIRAVHVDGAGRLWVGMRGRGLAVLEAGRWLNPDALAEAVGDQVNAIAEDDQGHLWLGTPAGVIWAPLAAVLAAARDERALPELRMAEISDTQPTFVVRSGKQPIVCRTAGGELLFATRKGVIGVNPARIAVNRVVPPVGIERVTVDGRPMTSGAPLTLPAGTREVAIDYTGVSFVGSSRLRFRYRLDGYDPEWVEAGARRTAVYANLPPRRYAFRVKAGNADGVWNEQGAALAFTIEPFFWQTWWFGLAAVVLFTAAIAAIARYASFRRLQHRLRTMAQQAALDRERARIARDIHDDIGNRLTAISLLSRLTLRDRHAPEKIGGHAAAIGATARQVTDSLDEIVWAVNPRNDTLRHLIDYLGQYAVEFLQAAGIECQAELPDHPPEHTLAADVRHNLFLVVKEALHNVVRHAGASEVTLRVDVAQRLTITVSDNGRGFDGAPVRDNADGLRNMRQRMAEIRGEFALVSAPGEGTRVTLTWSWPEPGAGRGGRAAGRE